LTKKIVEVKNQVTSYQSSFEEITNIASSLGLSESDLAECDQATLADKGLSQFVDKLPELQLQKKAIDMHTTIATSILGKIKQRAIDSYFSTEENLMTKSYVVSFKYSKHTS